MNLVHHVHRPAVLRLALLVAFVAPAAAARADDAAAAAVPLAPSPEPALFAGAAAERAVPGSVPLAGAPAAPARSAGGRSFGGWPLVTLAGVVLAALAGFRMLAARRVATLPGDVLEVLGETPLGGQHSLRVVRFGPRTLLVGVSAAGCRTLAELDDLQATECIVAACHGARVRPRAPRGPAPRPLPTAGEAA